MIHAYADLSMDKPIAAVGFVLLRSRRGDRELVETGTRVLNVETSSVPITGTHDGEYYAAVVAARAALAYTDEPIIIHLDNEEVVEDIVNRTWNGDDYFPHALYSFLPRFRDYHVHLVHRDNNEIAHEQARIGLRIGRDIHSEVSD